MLVSMNAMRIYEMVAHYAKTTEKYVLVIDNSKYFSLAADKQALIKTYYEDVIPEDELGEIFGYSHTFYEFTSQAVASDYATDWFPLYKDLDDKDYFIEAQVITPAGGIPYTNNNG